MKLFNKPTILLFSIFGSTLFGAFLFADNLNRLDKKKFIGPTILFAIVWTALINVITRKIPIPFFSWFISNIIGGIILIGPFWKQHIEEQLNYDSRSFFGPLSILLIIYGFLFLMIYFY